MKEKRKTKKKPIRYKKLFYLLSIVLIITSIVLSYRLVVMDVLTIKYLLIGLGSLFGIVLFLIFIYFSRLKVVLKIPFVLIGIILVAGEIFGIYNLNKTASFVQNIVSASVKEEIYNLYVLKSSDYEELKDLNGKNLGIYDNGNETLNDALKELKKSVTFKSEKSFDDMESFLNSGINKENESLFISASLADIVAEEYGELIDQFKVLKQITVSYKESVAKSDADVTKEAFIVYISGIDTYGSIASVSRSDVNILAVVNPNTNRVLLVNTPRDYYVMLHSKKAYDKLTHAGIYGVDESLTTLEDLYSVDIDFYIKVNFSSLIKIVDSLGGITVDSKYAFSYDGYTFKKGINKLDGKAALAFSRCRKELPKGDESRGENQEAVIKGLVSKISDPSIITKYSTILNTLSKSFVTNMSEENIYKLAKYQLSENPTWNISSANVTGTGASKSTYSAGKTKLYVMVPDEKTVTDAKIQINEVLNG